MVEKCFTVFLKGRKQMKMVDFSAADTAGKAERAETAGRADWTDTARRVARSLADRKRTILGR